MLTRSEVFSLAKKATRGAGFSWGMAEEAAVATVALYCVGQDGFYSLVQILENADGKKHPLLVTGSPVCGLTLGTYLADCGETAAEEVVIGNGIFQALCGELKTGLPNFPLKAPETIQTLAFRTYVPESTESRAKGAG
jgi:hypothetical protein